MANSDTSPSPRIALLIPSVAKTGIDTETAAGDHPLMDYYALNQRLNGELIDYTVVENDPRWIVRKAFGLSKDVGMAVRAFLDRGKYDSIFSNGENVSIPLAALFSLVRKRPGHVLIGHHVSTPKKKSLLKRLAKHMDAIFLYAETQQDYAVQTLGMPLAKLHLIPFHADHRFYRPMDVSTDNMISSAGLEWRDYPTMLAAVEGMDINVRLAAASPWSKHRNETEDRTLPTNVDARRYNYRELRDLYARSRFVVVPLYENDFQAGVTTILEAMSMGKAVIATRTIGQKDVIEDGVNGIYVPPGEPAALRAAIERLMGDPELTARLGAEARKTIEQRMTLDHWADRIARVVRESAAAMKTNKAKSMVVRPEEK
jgi:glycosyltransferase involved in cell wall biosynthesis